MILHTSWNFPGGSCGNPAKASDWLDRPCVQLGGHTPRDMLGSRDGARRVEELLLQFDDDQRRGPG